MERIINSIQLNKKIVSLDFIDLMGQAELGSSREMMVDQLQSPRCEAGYHTYFFIQPNSRTEYYLCRDRQGEEFSLFAKLDESHKCFNVYRHKAGDPTFRVEFPDFKLTFDADRTRWLATVFHNSFICEKCMYSKRERSYSISSTASSTATTTLTGGPVLLEIEQETEKIPTGQHWFYLNCRGKSAEFGEGLVDCPECTPGSFSPRRRRISGDEGSLHVHSNPPVVKKGELKVKFITNSREIQPSARNVQCSSSRHNGEIVFQLIKISDGIFNIDYRAPLSPIQAFFMALSTHYWV